MNKRKEVRSRAALERRTKDVSKYSGNPELAEKLAKAKADVEALRNKLGVVTKEST